MTFPDDQQPPDQDPTERTGEAGALAAASEEHPEGGDPLGPLNAVTEDDDEQ